MSNTDPTSPFAPPGPDDIRRDLTPITSGGEELLMDFSRLNHLANAYTSKGATIGYGVIPIPDEYDRIQLELLAQTANTALMPMYEDPRYQAYLKLTEDMEHDLLTFAYHPDTFVKNWLVVGASNEPVQRTVVTSVDTEGVTRSNPGIKVPKDIFEFVDKVGALRQVAQLISQGERTLKGKGAYLYGLGIRKTCDVVTINDKAEDANREVW